MSGRWWVWFVGAPSGRVKHWVPGPDGQPGCGVDIDWADLDNSEWPLAWFVTNDKPGGGTRRVNTGGVLDRPTCKKCADYYRSLRVVLDLEVFDR